MVIKVELVNVKTGKWAMAECTVNEEKVSIEKLRRSIPPEYKLITWWIP